MFLRLDFTHSHADGLIKDGLMKIDLAFVKRQKKQTNKQTNKKIEIKCNLIKQICTNLLM